jgi:hypothetical protein
VKFIDGINIECEAGDRDTKEEKKKKLKGR